MSTTPGVCPQCGAAALYPDIESGIACHQCGATFRRTTASCPECGAETPLEAEVCGACGSPLGIAAQVIAQRGGKDSPIWLEKTRAQAPGLKAEGEIGSRQRFQDLVEIDRRREEQWMIDQAKRTVDDRRIIGLLAGAVGVFVVVLGIALLVMILR